MHTKYTQAHNSGSPGIADTRPGATQQNPQECQHDLLLPKTLLPVGSIHCGGSWDVNMTIKHWGSINLPFPLVSSHTHTPTSAIGLKCKQQQKSQILGQLCQKEDRDLLALFLPPLFLPPINWLRHCVRVLQGHCMLQMSDPVVAIICRWGTLRKQKIFISAPTVLKAERFRNPDTQLGTQMQWFQYSLPPPPRPLNFITQYVSSENIWPLHLSTLWHAGCRPGLFSARKPGPKQWGWGQHESNQDVNKYMATEAKTFL